MKKGILYKILIISFIVLLVFANTSTLYAAGLDGEGDDLDNPTPEPTPSPAPTPGPSDPDIPSGPSIPTPAPEPEPAKTYSISGNVWEDVIENGVNIGKKLIDGISVSLLKGTDTNTLSTTTTNGYYAFSNLENGTYTVKFEYGNETYNGLTARSSISPNATETNNMAIDDQSTRLELINNSSSIDCNTLNYDTLTFKNGTNTTMLASKSVTINNNDETCNLSLIKRPINKIKLTKNISHVTVTLSDGSTLINWDINDSKKSYTQYVKDNFMTIIMDDEITHGAKLEITYAINLKYETDRTETLLDYFTPTFIFNNFSTQMRNMITMQNFTNILTTPIQTTFYLYDYLDNNLIFEKNNDWEYISNIAENIPHEGNITDKQVLVNKIIISPGQEKTLQLKASKLLELSNDADLNTYENYVEIVKYENSVGSLIYNEDGKLIKPGNLNLNNEQSINENINNEKDTAKAETLSRVPPFGEDLSQTITLIGIAVIIAEIIILVILKTRIKGLRSKFIRK